MAVKPVLKFFTDNNVPDSVGGVLIDRGHNVIRLRDVMAADAKDPVVAVAAIEAGRILVSWDRDFNHQRFQAPRFAGLSRIGMSCAEPEGAGRIEETIDLVEFAVVRSEGQPITILIGRGKVLVRC
jgi:hypothetical protein